MSADIAPAKRARSLRDVLTDGVRSFYEAQGCSFGQADLFFLDRNRSTDQILAVVQGLAGFAKDGGATVFRQVAIIVPAAEFESDQLASLANRLEQTAAFVSERLPARAIPNNWLSIKSCSAYQDNELLEIVRSVPQHSAIIINHMANYRRAGVVGNDPGINRLRLEEDAWAPHVAAIAHSLEYLAAERILYVAVLVGRLPPHRPVLMNAMRNIRGGVVGSERVDDLDSELVQHEEEIADHLAAGRIGAALAIVDAMPTVYDEQKSFLKIQLLQRAALPQMALDLIEKELVSGMDNFDAASLFRMAAIAEEAGGRVLAARLLRASIPRLAQREFLVSVRRLWESDESVSASSGLRRMNLL